LNGELELTVGGESYTLRSGDRDFLSANTTHSAFVPGDQPVTYLIGAKN
jgi:quercetin dioxygenase-like cupin family protein